MNHVVVRPLHVVLVLGVAGAACTDLRVDGEPQLSCQTNDDCPEGFLCASAIERCLDEAIVSETPIGVAADAAADVSLISRVDGFSRVAVRAAFTKAPTSVGAVVDGRLSIACERDGEAVAVVCFVDAQRDLADEADGGYDVVVVATDAAGNVASTRTRIELDTAAPALTAGSVVVRYAAGASPVDDVAALGPATAVSVQLTITETTPTTPVLAASGVALSHDDARSSGLLHVYGLEGAAGLSDGAHRLLLSVVDGVGNAADVDVGAIDVDGTAPAPAATDEESRVVFTRVPWGTRADPTPAFRVTGAENAAEANARILITTTPSLASSRLGDASVDGDGAFDVALQPLDVPRVFAHVVDAAGNVSAAVPVRDVVWTASLGGRIRDDNFSNPHALFRVGDFDPDGITENLRDEPERAGDFVGGANGPPANIVVRALPRRQTINTGAPAPPRRQAGALGYLPREQVVVAFGGVAARTGTQLTDTFVLRGDRWAPIVGVELPPVTGPLAFDAARELLVSLLVNGDTWGFDGFVWRQLPVARQPAASFGGPIAWDPVGERLVSVQGTQTWVLEGDTWRQLADAPIRAGRTFDGRSFDAGGVLAFDGVNGAVTLFGIDAGVGVLFSLSGDSWVRTAEGRAVSLPTAVENPATGAIHYVCGSGALVDLVWTGTAFVDGASSEDPLVACGAAYEASRRRLIRHGGTPDPTPNNQALIRDTVAVVDDGASVWRDLSPLAPPPMVHNSAGFAHFNPILDRTILALSFNTLVGSDVTIWDGETPVAGQRAPSRNDPPFFDGLHTRVLGFINESILVNGTWIARPALRAPLEGNLAYDHSADMGFGFGGSAAGFADDETFHIRGDVLQLLAPAHRPPPRTGAGLIDDVANDRMVLTGGGGRTDAWAFEADGDWHPLDDLPAGAGGFEVKLSYDSDRDVVVGLFGGRLYDLRGSSWVEVPVATLPRGDALPFFDENRGGLVFVGGRGEDSLVLENTRIDVASARAAVVARFNVGLTGAAAGSAFGDVTIDAAAGASGDNVEGAELLVWGTHGFVSLATNAAAASSPAALTVNRARTDLGVPTRREIFAVVRSPRTGRAAAAEVNVEQLELTLRYREP